VGFSSAWGYWLSAWIGNVSYAVVLFSALSYFVPVFGDGNTWQAILGASAVLWIIHALVLSGVREAAVTNFITTVAKVAPILLFIVLVIAAFNVKTFNLDFSGLSNPGLGSVWDQVKGTMLVTLWAFIGIEGASVVSGRASDRSDVGFSTVSGFVICLVLYSLVSLLSLGVLTQTELAALKNPSMAGVLEKVVGSWGAVVINIALVISVLGAFLSWTLLAAEIPFVAAKDGTMPSALAIENANGSPSASLWVTNGLVQAFLILAYFSNSTYMALFSIASVAILVPYVFSGAYAIKVALQRDGYGAGENVAWDIVKGSVATLYGCWLVYAADTKYLFMGAMLYAAGIVVYWFARNERGEKAFSTIEGVLAAALLGLGGWAAYLIATSAISPL
jgi:arginine:ornithine antiporter / lysine permease